MRRAPLDGERLRAALAARWARVAVVDETASTNADLLAAAAAAGDPAPDRTVLVAEHQVAGRGRLDRAWASPPRAGLTFSVLLRPTVPLARWGWLALLAGVALHEAVDATVGIATAVKWPNDLLVAGTGEEAAEGGAGRKLAGILAQTSDGAVVIGVGLNVSTTADELPVPWATSLALAGAAHLDRTDLLAAILTTLDGRYAQWADCDGDAAACGLAAAYVDACATIGSRVRVEVGGGLIEGDAVGVDELGRLVVRRGADEVPISAGDVEHLRTTRLPAPRAAGSG